MLGILGECDLDSTEEEELCFPCPKACEHTNTVRNKYDATGAYNSGIINTFINTVLKQQEATLETLCEPSLNAETLVEMTGWSYCVKNVIFEECREVCGERVAVHRIDNCEDCTMIIKDNEFYLNVLKVYREKKYPTRNNIESIVNLFGWTVHYDEQGIYLNGGSEAPLVVASIIPLLAIPLGVEVFIVGPCSADPQ